MRPARSAAAPAEIGPGATAIIAHRGAGGEAPANSLAAFERAVALSADMIEFDVRRTADDLLIVHHDAHLEGVPISSLTGAELARSGTRAPPTLEAVLELAQDRIAIDVELKESGYVDVVVDRLRRFGFEHCLATSFLDDVVLSVKRLAPELATGLLIGFSPPRVAIRRMLRSRADYLAPHFRLADAGVLRQADAAGRTCLLWTVNDPRGVERFLLDPRVAAVITDNPSAALATRAELTAGSEARSVRP